MRFIGRYELSESGQARLAWSGAAIVTRFKGTELSVRLHDENEHAFNAFQIVIDGTPRGVLKMKKDQELYQVASGLPDGTHDLELYKRTEARVGEVVFMGFEPADRLLPARPLAPRRIEIIGDSISTGYGNEGPGATCGFHPDQQNEFATYGALAARALGAEHSTIAWSGKTVHEMSQLFDRALPGRDASRWTFDKYQPDLVVINLGTNNFANADPGEPRFLRVYTELYERVRGAYPNAFIVCALGPMLSDNYPEGRHNLTQARKYMRTVTAKLKARDSQVELLEFPEQKHSDGLGCGFHPSTKTHALMADRLVALARERLGW